MQELGYTADFELLGVQSLPDTASRECLSNTVPGLLAPETAIPAPRKGQLGLVLLCEPSPGSDGERNFPIDIVFVHGLNGDIKGTWTHENGTFWPRDLLHTTVPGARIFSFGYDSRIFFSKSDSEYRDYALGLVRDLHYLEHNTDKVQPIIFICHSLGGIIVKEAINVAHEREWSQEVLNRSRGIVFLGTPHKGSGVAEHATLLGNILGAVWSPASFIVPGPRNKLVSDLERNSEILFGIADRFAGRTKFIKIASFYETDQTLLVRNVVVDKNSGVLGLENERRWPLYGNHCDICRFDNHDSGNYKAVVAAICEMATSILAPRESSESKRSLTYSEQECMQQLNTVDIIEFEAQIDERLPGTLLWLRKDVHYTKWLAKSSIGLLLVTGYAGCGKTVLSSYLRNMLPSDILPTSSVCRFYCDAKVRELCNAVGLMRSVIHQVAMHSYEVLRMVVRAAKHDHWLWGSFERLWTLFEDIATSNENGEIIIVIDAIDEFEDRTQRQISSRIVHLMQSKEASTIKFLITSQPHASAVTELRRCSLRLALESKQEAVGEDVNVFIHERLKKLQAQKGWSNRIRRRLTEALESKADRSFLWVSFTLAFLEQRDILDMTDLEDALSHVPPDLTKFYSRFLESIVTRESPGSALRLLNMVLSSIRPLHVNELAVLLSIDGSHKTIGDTQRDYAIRGVQAIQQVLGPLVKSHRSNIQLVHTTLKEHLASSGDEYGLDEQKGHELLAERCMRYLLLQDSRRNSVETMSSPEYLASPTTSLLVEEGVGESSSDIQGTMFGTMFADPDRFDVHSLRSSGPGYELYDYAIRFWSAHFDQCQASDTSPLYCLAVDLYDGLNETRWDDYLRIAAEGPNGYPSRPDPLTLSCFYGHHTITERLLIKHNVSDLHVGRALYWSASQGYIKCVRLLHSHIQLGFDTSLCYVSGRSPLAAAAANGQTESVDFLIREGPFSLNEQDSRGLTPMSLAASRSQEHVVSVMLSMQPSKDLKVNLPDDHGRSALFWACSSNSRNSVDEMLQDGRTNSNLLDCQQRNALSWACEDGLADIVKLFVDNRSVVLGYQDDRGNTPLIYAVKSRDWHTVKNLFRRYRHTTILDHDADLNIAAKDREGRNAISWAASTRDSRILDLLLAHGSSEASAQDSNSWPPLAWTMDPPGFTQNAIRLIPHCRGSINGRDYLGSSLLSTAISWGQFETARILIENTSIDVNAKNDAGRTALSFAASSGSLDTVKLLVDLRNADTSIADNAGKLPLHWARSQSQSKIVDYLERITGITTSLV